MITPVTGAIRPAYRRDHAMLPTSCNASRGWSVPAGGPGMPPGAARAAVAVPDIPQTPSDLGARIRPPVAAGAAHFAAGHRLRNPVRPGESVVGPVVPAALPRPKPVQAVKVPRRPAIVRDQDGRPPFSPMHPVSRVHPAEPSMPDTHPLRHPLMMSVHLDPRSPLRQDRSRGHFRGEPDREKRRCHDRDGLSEYAAAPRPPDVEAGLTM